MAKAKIPKSPDPITQGFDRRKFLSVGPVSLLMASSPPEASPGQFSKEFQALVVEGTRQLMAHGGADSTFPVIGIDIADGVDEKLKERVRILNFKESSRGCHTCHSKEHGPHPRQLYLCKECGDRKELSRKLEGGAA